MDQELLQKLDAQEKKLDEIARSIEKMRKYFFWTLVITLAVIVLPLIGLIFVVPQFLSNYSNLGI